MDIVGTTACIYTYPSRLLERIASLPENFTLRVALLSCVILLSSSQLLPLRRPAVVSFLVLSLSRCCYGDLPWSLISLSLAPAFALPIDTRTRARTLFIPVPSWS
jgi:hypothetical protein